MTESAITLAVGVSVALYLLPTLVAVVRRKQNVAAIGALNVLLGWSVVGWIGALVWALSTQVVDLPQRDAV